MGKYLAKSTDLLTWRQEVITPRAKTWRPHALRHEQWPPDYLGVYNWRMEQLARLRANPELLASAKAYYSTRPGEFIMHWMDTYDPRLSGNKWVPFVFFWRQREFIIFLHSLRLDSENGLAEKCRDAGVTWLACGYSIWSWLFIPNDAIGWGSRKQDLVDKLGDPSSIFEKMRLAIWRLPDVFLPAGLVAKEHTTFMKLINPENGAVITGEAGDNIGRGGRTSMYLKDEAAHYERPEKIEAALGDNTNVQVDISSVNGLGNVFHRRREAGMVWRPGAQIERGFTRVFIFDWRDHPGKTQEWYDTRKARYEREGMSHIFAQEVDRNYSSAISNTIIPYEWIVAAIDAHKRIKWRDGYGVERMGIEDKYLSRKLEGALDVADEGIDRNAFALREGIILRTIEEWGERDIGVTTRRVIASLRSKGRVRVQYDIIGMGSAVKAEYNRLIDEGIIERGVIQLVPWNAGGAVVNPYERIIPDDDDSAMNKDIYGNMKAQAWWSIRTRFYKTFKNITEGVIYPIADLISLDSTMPLLQQLMKEFAQPTRGENKSLQTIVNKKPDGTKSPNLADAGVMAYFPVPRSHGEAAMGSYGMGR